MKNDTNAPDVGNKDGFNGGAIQHTPGPWIAHFEEDVAPGSASMEIGYNGSCIARVYGGEDFPCLDPSDETDAQMAANAHLIAAGPELLAALRDMVRVWPDERCGCAAEPEGTICRYCEDRNNALIDAAAAIAKATRIEPLNKD